MLIHEKQMLAIPDEAEESWKRAKNGEANLDNRKKENNPTIRKNYEWNMIRNGRI